MFFFPCGEGITFQAKEGAGIETDLTGASIVIEGKEERIREKLRIQAGNALWAREGPCSVLGVKQSHVGGECIGERHDLVYFFKDVVC